VTLYGESQELSLREMNPCSNAWGETAKSLLECKAKFGRSLDPDSNVRTREMIV